MFFIYAVLVHVAFLLLLPLLLGHPKLREGVASRLGFTPPGWPDVGDGPRIWFHGASAGDLLAMQPMVDELRDLRPGCSVVVTTVTNSGMKVARQGMPGVDDYGYLPYDLPWSVGRVIRVVRPRVLVLEYAEVWPALIRAAKRSGARILITNGRFDERALGRYRWLYRLIGNPLRHVDLLCMREADEAQHALAIGAEPLRVRVTGNTKFDRLPGGEGADEEKLAGLAAALGLDGEVPVLVAGSTHEGEEGPILDAYANLRKVSPDLRLVIAPRYVERAGKVVGLARERGLKAGLRSTRVSSAHVAILDSVGELATVYQLASVVVVGGSFVRRGGQNILEPAARGKAVLFGPHMHNFADSVRVLVGRGGIQVDDFERLERTLADLLTRPDELVKLGRLARSAVGEIRGASRVNAKAILELLDTDSVEEGR